MPLNVRNLALPVSLVLGIALSAPVVQANEIKLVSKFSISYLGFGVGRMSNALVVSNDGYVISGKAKASSVAALITNTTAKFVSSGKILGRQVVPSRHALKFRSGKKKGDLQLTFARGNVAGVSSVPKVKYKRGSIPVEQAHLKAVLDPLSSLVFPVNEGEIGRGRDVCNRVLPIFDGKARINLVFSYLSKGKGKAKGFDGETITCSVRYQPVSGIRPRKKNIKFMQANRKINVTLARVGNSRVYSLFGFSVPTQKGLVTGKANTFEIR